MILESLYKKIELLKARINSHRSIYSSNEFRTRIGLIDPLLLELGWDVSDPTLVGIEHEIGSRLADYALLNSDGKPVVILDAKRLGESLTNHRDQIAQYIFYSSAKYAGLTNGDRWEIYDTSISGDLNAKRILDVALTTTSAHEVVLKMLLLWRPNSCAVNLVDPNSPLIVGEDAPSTELEPPTGWVRLSEFERTQGGPIPSSIRLWDGEEYSISRWYEVLTLVIQKLYENFGDQVVQACPVESTTGRYIINTEPVTKRGSAYQERRTKKVGPIYVDCNLTAVYFLRDTQILLNHFDQDPSKVYLKMS